MFGSLRQHLNRLGAKHQAAGTFDENNQASALAFYTLITSKLMDAERSSIFIVDPENRKIWLKSGTGMAEHDIEVSPEGSIVGQVIESGQAVMMSDLEHREGAHRLVDESTGFTTHNAICVPIFDPRLNQAVGAIQALNKKQGRDFDEEDLDLLKEVAKQLQWRVSRIYMDQEIYGLSEKVLLTARRTLRYLTMGIVLGILALLALMLMWLLVPALT